MRLLAIFFLFVNFLYAFEVKNGKSLIFELQNIDKNSKITFLNKTYKPIKHPKKEGYYLVIIPIDYKTEAKEYSLEYTYQNKKVTQAVHVKKENYPKEQLSVEPSKVKPPKKYLDRIHKEYEEAKKIYATSTDKLYFNSPFIVGIKTQVTSEFGSARVYNDVLKSYHGGVDFRAKEGTKIVAINRGKVVIASERYYAGGSVVIDHGFGIYSAYFHLSKIKVKKGDLIKQNQVIALSGKSGRVTGPHLHLGIKISGISVDPLDFINQINALLALN